jgi:hypothetical protein
LSKAPSPSARGRRAGGLRAGAIGWAARRPTAAAALLYLLLSLLMFAPGFAPGRTLSASDELWTATPWDSSRSSDVPGLGSNQELDDSVTQFQPAFAATRAALPDIPLWDPHVLSGRPYLADPQSAVFSPYSVPSYVLPFWKSLAVSAAMKLFVAAFGAFLLGRAVGMRFGGALMAGLAFGFSLWSVSWVSWTLMSVWTFFPWLALLGELCLRRPGPLPVAGLAVVTGLQFLGGHPSSSFQILVVTVLFLLGRLLATPSLRRGIVPRAVALFAGLAAGAALAAVMLIPFAELLARSGDVTTRSGAASLLRQPPRFLLGLFLHDYWGHGRTTLVFASYLPERAYYVGALPLMLAAAALVARPRPVHLALVAVGAASLAIATGQTPLYDLVVSLPGFDAANNGRFGVIAVLCLALLAGWGLDELTGRRLEPARRRAIAGLSVALLALPVAIAAPRIDLGALGDAVRVAWGFATPPAGGAERTAAIRLASVLEWLVLAAAAAALVVLRVRGRLAPSAFAALAAVLVTADLFKAGAGYNPAIPLSHARQPETPALRFLRAATPQRFTALKSEAPLSLVRPIPPNVAMRLGIYDARGYVIPTEDRYNTLWRRVINPDPGCYYFFCTLSADRTPRALTALGVIGVSLLLQDRLDPPLRELRAAYAGRDARVYRNPRALPRAFLVDRQVVARSGDAALRTLASPRFPARAAVVTEERLPGLADGIGPGSAFPGRARIADYGRERVVVETDAPRRSLLVLTDTWYPGWKAEVDGAAATVHRVDYLIRGVPVPAGRHRVEFRFEPASWRAGWIVSALAFAGVAATALLGWRRRRTRGA